MFIVLYVQEDLSNFYKVTDYTNMDKTSWSYSMMYIYIQVDFTPILLGLNKDRWTNRQRVCNLTYQLMKVHLTNVQSDSLIEPFVFSAGSILVNPFSDKLDATCALVLIYQMVDQNMLRTQVEK